MTASGRSGRTAARERARAGGHRAQFDGVPDQLGGRHLGPDQGALVAGRVGLGAQHPAAPAGQVAHHRADEVVRDPDGDLVDRLEQRHLALLGGLPQRQRAGGLERGVGGVDAVRLAVDQGDPQVDHRVAGDQAALHLGADALLDRRDVVVRHRAADDLVDELEAGAAGQRLDLDVADGVLAVPAGLLDVPAVALGRRATASRAARP